MGLLQAHSAGSHFVYGIALAGIRCEKDGFWQQARCCPAHPASCLDFCFVQNLYLFILAVVYVLRVWLYRRPQFFLPCLRAAVVAIPWAV
eukprot:8883281-Pyramimonas_sp.AAC.1